MVANKKLGKGLSSLLGNKEFVNNDNNVNKGLLLIPIEKIFRDESQPRKQFSKEKLDELAQSIKKNGLIQPLIVTKRNIDTYFGGRDILKVVTKQPFEVLGIEGQYDVDINVKGGGLSGQAGAIRLGISRGIEKVNPEFRKILKENGFLTRDSRRVERKKPGQPGARKKFQFSKR